MYFVSVELVFHSQKSPYFFVDVMLTAIFMLDAPVLTQRSHWMSLLHAYNDPLTKHLSTQFDFKFLMFSFDVSLPAELGIEQHIEVLAD